MNSEKNQEDGLEKNNESLCILNTEKSVPVLPEIKQVIHSIETLNKAASSVLQSDVMQAAVNVGKQVVDFVASIDFSPVLKKISEAMIPFQYLDLLKRLKWPLFLIDDDILRQKILDICAEKDDEDAVTKIVLDYCNEDFLNLMEADWANCETITEARKPILSEAILMHKQGHYYASTSMLMCQVYGIASDIVGFAKKNGLELDETDKDLVSECYEIDRKDIDKEKGRLIQMMAIAESGPLLWNAMVEYLQSEILCSSDSKQRWATQPLRNKICHGNQLNFGTKEHSLKAILTIDMLIQLMYEIQRIAEIQKHNAPEERMDADEQ